MTEGVRAQRVLFPAGRRSLRGVLAWPNAGPNPGVLVIHEAFGLNQDIADKCERLAAMGYVALAPDLYSGRGPKPFCVLRAMRDLRAGRGQAFDDLDAARSWLAALPQTDPSRIGVIGFCMGGGFALLYAVRAPVGAAAVFYGAVPDDAGDLAGICPVVASYGGRDRVFRPHGERLARYLRQLGVDHDVKVYPEAGHSFMSDHRGLAVRLLAAGPMRIGYDPAAAEDAWQRVSAFFARHLRGSPGS
ncbi:Carboxymethylenebutenolidase [bacterium HR29]|nr:Carboxymethylenebutenolidase [bacterium HR29]